MTNKEIIQGLKAVRTMHNGNYAPQIDEAIKALEIINDFEGVGMTNEEVIELLMELRICKDDCSVCRLRHLDGDTHCHHEKALNLAIKALEQTEWIPVKWHIITDEEREREEYPKEWVYLVDNIMPNDEEEILVTIKSSKGNLYVEKDICYLDDGYSLDSGYDWISDVVAWMPLPKPYKAESEEV